MNRTAKLKQEVKKYFTHSSHGFDHVLRVYRLAVRIAEKGAEMCKPILEKLGYTAEQIKIISDAIRTHRYKNQLKPNSKVGEILQDADRLDLLGAIGVARIFTRGGERGSPLYDPNIKPDKVYRSGMSTAINHFYEKVLKVNSDSFHTETAKQIAKSRYIYSKQFVERFLKEWEGEQNDKWLFILQNNKRRDSFK